ncbi:MAG: extracellular solute-binding protein [Candidatus Pacebacteria bacterium]|nr:extracellular solute-binding protein [Candidatus Paceibacterota bacterium]
MKETNTFQLILLGVFGFFIIIGVMYFAGGGGLEQDEDEINYGTITVWGFISERDFSDIFSELDFTMEIEYVQKPEETLLREMEKALAKSKGPDVIIMPPGQFISFREYLLPLPETYITNRDFSDLFVEQAEAYIGEEGIYAMPLVIDPMVMYWNRSIFNSNGVSRVPSVWDEFKTLTPKMTIVEGGTTITRSTLPMGEFVNVTHAKDILSMLIMQSGAPIVSSDRGVLEVDVNSPIDGIYPGVTAFDFYTEFSNQKLPTYNWNRSLPSSVEMFAGNNSAVYLGYASEAADIKRQNPHLNFDVAMVPQKRDTNNKITYGRMSGAGVLINSNNKQGAAKFVSVLSGKSSDPNKLTYSLLLSETLHLPPTHRLLLNNKPNDAFMSVFYDSASISKSWPDPSPGETNIIFSEAIDTVVSDRFSTDVVVSGLERQLDSIISEFIRSSTVEE